MRLFILLLIFLFHFVSHVTGFEYSDDVGCASINSQNNETIYTHTWLIKDYQDLYNRLGDEKKFFSEKFFTPSMLNNQRDYYAWRILIYPRSSDDKCMGIYLTAFKTDYEEQDGLNSREASYKFEIYLNNNNNNNNLDDDKLATRESLKFLVQSRVGNKLFSFTKNINAYGYKFCVIPNIFPNGDTWVRTNLVIRVHFYKSENITGSIPNFFDKSEQYFNSEIFSDTIFKFSCGSEIRASSIVLAIKYPHFKKLLESQKDSKKMIIHYVDGASYNCFYNLLYFIYSGKLDQNLSYKELIELYNESNSREINDLKDIVSCKILKFLNENTWNELLLLGWKTKNKVIKNAALKFVSDNWMKVKGTDKMREIESLNNIEWLEELIVTKLFGVEH